MGPERSHSINTARTLDAVHFGLLAFSDALNLPLPLILTIKFIPLFQTPPMFHPSLSPALALQLTLKIDLNVPRSNHSHRWSSINPSAPTEAHPTILVLSPAGLIPFHAIEIWTLVGCRESPLDYPHATTDGAYPTDAMTIELPSDVMSSFPHEMA